MGRLSGRAFSPVTLLGIYTALLSCLDFQHRSEVRRCVGMFQATLMSLRPLSVFLQAPVALVPSSGRFWPCHGVKCRGLQLLSSCEKIRPCVNAALVSMHPIIVVSKGGLEMAILL